MKNVGEIVKNWLKTNGYDGLCNDECGCGLNDFAPCDNCIVDCEPAYRWNCKDCSKRDTECVGALSYMFCYRPVKQENAQ